MVDPKKDFESEYAKFMGDKDGRPGNNCLMLMYLAGLKNERERFLVTHAWQLHDHMCNTGRADASEWDWRYGVSIALMLPALAFGFEQKWIVMGAYLGGAVFFLFLPTWRKYLSGRNG